MASAVVAKALGALFKIPLTNMLGGVGMSYFSCAYSIFMPVYALTVTGLSSAVTRMTAKSIALGMYDNVRRVRHTATLIFSLFGLAGSLAVLLLAKPFSLFSSGGTESALAVAMIAPSVFFGCITAVERGYYEGMSNMYPTAVSQAVEGIVKVVAGLWLCGYVNAHGQEIMAYFPEITDVRAISAAAGILGVTLSSVGAMLFFAVLSLFRKKQTGGENTVMSRREISKELISTALPTGISAVVTNLTAIIDMWTIIGCISYFGCRENIPQGVAKEDIPDFIYGSFAGIALTVFNLVPSVTNMLGKGILPCITESWAEGDKQALRHHTLQALLTSAIIAVPCAFGLGVLAPEILLFLFARQSEEAEICINSLRLLMPGMVCLCISFPLFSMLQAIGKASAPLKIMFLGTVIKLAGNLILIPFMGADGAGISTSVCYVVILAVSLAVYIKSTGVSISIAPFISVIYAGLLCGATAYLTADISERYGVGDITVIFSAVASGGIVYLLSLWLLSVRKYRKSNRQTA
ncbi:MAG: polysaccharide biosynthesis C-terminal domain-containing protein [Ruminococcus flavefaciens]|nr:polysaccharide biosynthesis C-terminal domain-containing protein [Ruminococcus flavefaciens]